ncbi:hypothetical protein PI125_g7967 [Phytophthora idaei]|nr:hypothetical protein PI125_g7967 [Phytophthora idaei]
MRAAHVQRHVPSCRRVLPFLGGRDDQDTKKKKTETQVLASVDALAQQLQSFMLQQQ